MRVNRPGENAVDPPLQMLRALPLFGADSPEVRPPFQVSPDAVLPDGRDVGRIDIQTNGYWHYSFLWHQDLAAYSRADAGQVMIDAGTGELVTVRTVVVQLVEEFGAL